jgi:hypothetical protein
VQRREDDREEERSDAQEATETRDAAVAELEAWMSTFHTVARIAFTDRPQQLEKLKLVG